MANDLTTTTDHTPAAFSARSLTPSTTAVLERAFDPEASFTAADLALIEPVASAVASIQVVDERKIRQSIGALAAALPSQDAGEAGSKLRLNTYMSMLAGCDERALSHACRRCLDELDWFPTVHQLKERIQRWVSPEAVAISRARAIIRAGRRAPAGDDIADLADDERAKVNAFLRTRGLTTRFAADGSTYHEIAEQAEAA